MKILLTGASGLLGGYLLKTNPGHDIYSTWLRNPLPIEGTTMELSEKRDIYYAFNVAEPDIVIHTAGVGDVDKCERPMNSVKAVNVDSVRHIMSACEEYKAKLVYISTNAVFDGHEAPYHEGSVRFPINRYGKMKVMAENIILQSPGEWLIIRPILLYGWPWPGGRANWAIRALDAIKNRYLMHIVNDRWTQPTYAGACASAIWALLDKGCRGVYHISGGERMTLYAFCQAVATAKGRGKSLFAPCGSEMFRTLAPRPVDTSYTLDKMRQAGIEPVGVAEGLKLMLAEDRA